MEYKKFSEFHHLLFPFWFLSIFDIFFSILRGYSCQKMHRILVLFYCMDPRFYHRIMQNYGFFFFQKIWDVWNPKCHQNSTVYNFFLIFFSIFDIFFFLFHLFKLVKNSEIFCSVLLEGLENLSTNSGNF